MLFWSWLFIGSLRNLHGQHPSKVHVSCFILKSSIWYCVLHFVGKTSLNSKILSGSHVFLLCLVIRPPFLKQSSNVKANKTSTKNLFWSVFFWRIAQWQQFLVSLRKTLFSWVSRRTPVFYWASFLCVFVRFLSVFVCSVRRAQWLSFSQEDTDFFVSSQKDTIFLVSCPEGH
jgi:hypothetical protein